MIQRILRIGIAVLFIGLGIWQFIEGEIGNGIFWVLLTVIPVFLYLRHERILMALWYLRKQDMASAGKHLAAIRTPESTLIKSQLAYYYFLQGVLVSQTNLNKAEQWMRKALHTGLRQKEDQAMAKLQLAGMALSKRRKIEAQTLLTEAKKLDSRGLMKDQIKMLQQQLKRI
jgi:TM2 domain-containing membrane protein YozV